MHNTRNNTKNNSKIGTAQPSKRISRNSSKIDDQKRRKVKRKQNGSKSEDLKKVSQLLNQELKVELGRQPSNNPNSVYELKPTVCQSQSRTSDVVFHDHTTDENSKSSSLRWVFKLINLLIWLDDKKECRFENHYKEHIARPCWFSGIDGEWTR